MELTFPKTEVEASGDIKTQMFALGDQRVIMNLLRSKLYSSPIRTICQEVMSNARDAHREVGKGTQPIEVTLPNGLDPTLRIQDFGPGITPDRMANVFVKYGNSTKRVDNLQTGGFGLGAKSPFSYVDSFTVITVTPEKGKMIRREYIAYIDETQIGAMSLVKQAVTNDPQGTAILVPVKPGDFDKFRTAVHDVALYWEPRPIVHGDTSFAWDEIKYEFKDPNGAWAVCTTHDENPRVIVDGIQYRLQPELLYPNEWGRWSSRSSETELLKSGFRMFVPIGVLKVTASREDLDYQPEVIDKLKEMIKSALKDLQATALASIATMATYREAIIAYYKLRRKFSWVTSKGHTWNGLELKDTIEIYDYSYVKCWSYHRGRKDRSRYSTSSLNLYDEHSVILNDDTDNEKNAALRAATAFDKHPGSSVINVVCFKKPAPDPLTGIVDPAALVEAKEEYVTFEKATNWSQLGFPNLTSYPPKVYPKAVRKNYQLVKAKTWDGHNWSADNNIDMKNGKGVYIELYNGVAYLTCNRGKDGKILKNTDDITYNQHVSNDTLRSIQKELKIDITGICSRYVGRLGKGWIPLRHKVTDYVRNILKNKDARDLAHVVNEVYNEGTWDKWPKDEDAAMAELIHKDGVAYRFMDIRKRALAIRDDCKNLEWMMNLLVSKVGRKSKWKAQMAKKGVPSWKTLTQEFFDTYPLMMSYLHYNDYYNGKRSDTDFVAYINMKDEMLKKGIVKP